MQSLRSDAAWTAIDTVISSGLGLLFRLAVARVLAPDQFGIVAIALAFISILTAVNNFGLTAALIQRDREKLSPSLINSCFTASCIISGALCLLTIGGLAPFLSWYYQNPTISALTSALAITLIGAPFATVSSALLSRERRFRDLAIIRVASSGISILVAALYLWMSADVWVIAVQLWVAQLVSTVGLTIAARWKFRLNLDKSHIGELFGYSTLVCINDIVGTLTANVGTLIIGRIFTPSEAAIYGLAVNLTETVRRVIMSVLNRVMFVHYSINKHDNHALRTGYVRTLTWNCRVIFPIMTACIFFSDAIVNVLLGPEWKDMESVMQILAVSIMIQTAGGTTSTLYKAIGKPGLDTSLSILTNLLLLLPAIVAGSYWAGLEGAAAATAATKLIAILLRQVLLDRLIGATLVAVCKTVLAALAAQLPIVAAFGLKYALMPDADPVASIGFLAMGLIGTGLIEVWRIRASDPPNLLK